MEMSDERLRRLAADRDRLGYSGRRSAHHRCRASRPMPTPPLLIVAAWLGLIAFVVLLALLEGFFPSPEQLGG